MKTLLRNPYFWLCLALTFIAGNLTFYALYGADAKWEEIQQQTCVLEELTQPNGALVVKVSVPALASQTQAIRLAEKAAVQCAHAAPEAQPFRQAYADSVANEQFATQAKLDRLFNCLITSCVDRCPAPYEEGNWQISVMIGPFPDIDQFT